MKKTIVVVDDFPNTQKVIEFTLKKIEETEFLMANDGKEALKFFDGRKVDLLITDYNMPVMDGLELIKNVRAIPDYAFIPILVLTTETDERKKDATKKAAVTGWVQKPFKTDDFLAVVKRCLK